MTYDPSDMSVLLGNFDSPFVSHQLAVDIATLVIKEKYPEFIFSPGDNPQVFDDNEAWEVLFSNKGKDTNSDLSIRTIKVKIRKFDAAIISIK